MAFFKLYVKDCALKELGEHNMGAFKVPGVCPESRKSTSIMFIITTRMYTLLDKMASVF